MRTITTPQARRRLTTATARARLDRILPADLSTDPGLLALDIPSDGADGGLPEPAHDLETVPAGLSEHEDGADWAVEPPGAARANAPVPSNPDPPPALSAPRLLEMYGAPAHPGRTASAVTHEPVDLSLAVDTAPARRRSRPGSLPERDPPGGVPTSNDAAPDDAALPEQPAVPDLPGDSRPGPRPGLDPSPSEPSPTPNSATVSHPAPPKLPLRFRLPGAFALDRRAVLGLTVLLVLATGYAVQHFWLGRPHPVAVPAIAIAESVSDRTTEGAPALQPTGPSLVIDIGGKVQHPGLRTLPAGSRVADALAAAGGPLPDTDTSFLNLARPLTDGEQILVGTDPLPGVAATAGPAGPVSLNRANADQLDSLPGVGPALAQRILQYRLAHGPFQSLDQLRHVPGIGPRKYEDLKSLLTL
ncbi:helix-hairpin-helix domain-containing protein [Kitasatospora cineracea]|uniref:helix-hairpin-helix domain-containing protein n=1 Tax=Kitasatospora cineracea TaxID=88074 RepID=UPI0036DD9752